jgi:hypothetical protein
MKETTNTNTHTETIIQRNWNAAENRFDYSFVFAFRTKDTYFEFRRCWKQSYLALTASIRGLKASIKTLMRQREYAGQHQSDLEACKRVATVQLAMLHAAKCEANRQYLAAKTAGH